MRPLVVRADAGPGIGVGHLMRTLAILEAWRDAGGDGHFVVARGASVIEARCRAEGIGVTSIDVDAGSQRDVEETMAFVTRLEGVLVLDGYRFATDFQDAAVHSGGRCVVVDDHVRLDRYAADVIVDPNVVADELVYLQRAPGARVLAGRRYALLRREFRLRTRNEGNGPVHRVLVGFGGADEERLTEWALTALVSSELDVELCVLVGAANVRRREIARMAASHSAVTVIFDAQNVAEVMASADLAVTAAGTTCSELAFMGLPALVVVTAENQRKVAEGFGSLGSVRVLGDAGEISTTTLLAQFEALVRDEGARRAMTSYGRQAIDGLGAVRVATTVNELIS